MNTQMDVKVYQHKICDIIAKWGFGTATFNVTSEVDDGYYWIDLYGSKNPDAVAPISGMKGYRDIGFKYICTSVEKTQNSAYFSLLKKVRIYDKKIRDIKKNDESK